MKFSLPHGQARVRGWLIATDLCLATHFPNKALRMSLRLTYATTAAKPNRKTTK